MGLCLLSRGHLRCPVGRLWHLDPRGGGVVTRIVRIEIERIVNRAHVTLLLYWQSGQQVDLNRRGVGRMGALIRSCRLY